jgi:hypothetical protein
MEDRLVAPNFSLGHKRACNKTEVKLLLILGVAERFQEVLS